MSLSRSIPIFALVLGTGCKEIQSIYDESSRDYVVELNIEGGEDVVEVIDELTTIYEFDVVHVYELTTQGFSARFPPVIADELVELDAVRDVWEDDEQQVIEPDSPVEKTIEADADEITTGISRIEGPYLTATDWSGVVVAVIDTGIDATQELNVIAEKDIVCTSQGECAAGSDPNGHGTHVAGTIGALAGDGGVVGVAPGVPMHAVRVLSASGSGTYGDILAGLEYVAQNPEIRVVNMSIGGPSSSMDGMIEEAIRTLQESGVVVAIAAGNDGADTVNTTPAGLDMGIVVSAYEINGQGKDQGFASFSNYGDAVDIAAPGVDVLSTLSGGGWGELSGTSMAAPHVAGAAAAYIDAHPNASADAVIQAIISSGEDDVQGQGGAHPEPLLDFAALMD